MFRFGYSGRVLGWVGFIGVNLDGVYVVLVSGFRYGFACDVVGFRFFEGCGYFFGFFFGVGSYGEGFFLEEVW